ncbi:MAG: lysylphosphatidylglycerol synthase transmembrane domain-containing protein [Vicinamibacterales bacterium]
MTDSDRASPSLFSPASAAILVAGGVLLAISIRQAGWDSIVASVTSIGAWLGVVVALGAVRMAVRAQAWAVCSRATDAAGIPFGAAFSATLAADAVGNLTPLGLLASEPTKVLMARRHVTTASSLSSVAVENGFYTASVVAMLLGGVWVLLQRADVPPLLERVGEGIVVLSMVGALAALWLFRARPAVLSRAGAWVATWSRRGAARHTLEALEQSVYDVVRWPAGRLVQVVGWEAMFHVAAVAEVWLILRTMPASQQATLVDAFLMETTGRFITVAFKFIPYRLGVDELGSGSVSQLLGLGASTGVALALVRRLRILLLNAAGIALLARHRAGTGRS